MKKLILAASILALSAQAKAALFINNNTNCEIYIVLQAHDLNHGTCAMQSNRFPVYASTSQAYNNVTSLNTLPGWQNGPAVITGGTTAWGWDSALFGGVSLGGHLGTNCSGSATITILNGCGSATVQADWYTSGTNTFIDFN